MLQLTFNPGLTLTALPTTWSWVERGAVRVKCLAQEHNTLSLASAHTKTASGLLSYFIGH